VAETLGKATTIAHMLDGRLLCCAESCTGGRLTQAFADLELSSEWLMGGLVAYRSEVKRRHLDVQAPTVYSERGVAEMAAGASRFFGAAVAVATSGVIGTDPVDGVEPGTVFVATLVDDEIATRTHRFGERGAEAADRAAAAALDDLLVHLRDRVPTR
jgi:nicotinamide-nucleotide amidase